MTAIGHRFYKERRERKKLGRKYTLHSFAGGFELQDTYTNSGRSASVCEQAYSEMDQTLDRHNI